MSVGVVVLFAKIASNLQFMRLCTTLSLAICNPTIAIVRHAIINGYKNVLVVAIQLDYFFPLAEKVKEYLKDPSKFAVVVALVWHCI